MSDQTRDQSHSAHAGDPAGMLVDRLITEWKAHHCLSPKEIQKWSETTPGVKLPANTVRGWLIERRVPRHWEQLKRLLQCFTVDNITEWHGWWREAVAENRPPDPDGDQPSVCAITESPQGFLRGSFRGMRGALIIGVLVVLAIGGSIAWYGLYSSSPVAIPRAGCHEVVQYRVTSDGNVVNDAGKGFDKVAPGELFVHDSAHVNRAIEGRLYGTVQGRNLVGHVRMNKLEFDNKTQVCP